MTTFTEYLEAAVKLKGRSQRVVILKALSMAKNYEWAYAKIMRATSYKEGHRKRLPPSVVVYTQGEHSRFETARVGRAEIAEKLEHGPSTFKNLVKLCPGQHRDTVRSRLGALVKMGIVDVEERRGKRHDTNIYSLREAVYNTTIKPATP